jgi:hypothetical protein
MFVISKVLEDRKYLFESGADSKRGKFYLKFMKGGF